MTYETEGVTYIMNYENLHKLIERYEENIYYLNNAESDEKFKWHAVRRFQDAWFAPDADALSFSELFHNAIKGSSILVNNGTVQPANGVVKLAEKAPDEVEHLVRNVLFADDNGDLDLRQDHMEEFLEGMEALLQRHYPASWKYRQDRHAASCYLAMFAPEQNYIYKYSPVEAFAQHVEFGKDIGSGASFKLAHYYELGDIVVAALREHPDLLRKHAELLDDTYYKDDSLHLLAFDIIYCADTYGFFRDLTHRPKKEAIKAYTIEQKQKAEEEARLAAIDEVDEQIRILENQLDVYRSISLVGTQVQMRLLGTGVVVEQDINRVRVRFGDVEKQYFISKKYPMRPTFEDDAEIVEAMTEYEAKLKELEALKKKRAAL